MKKGYILLVEDNENEEMLTARALKKNNILNKVVLARDGQETLDYLFGDGEARLHGELPVSSMNFRSKETLLQEK